MAGHQGLDRGLRALEAISLSPTGLTVADIAAKLGIDRAIAYRIVETLEPHAYITRDAHRRFRLSVGAVSLAGRFHPQLIQAAEPILQDLADEAGAPAFLTMAHGAEECVAVLSADPVRDAAPVRVGYRIGMRHSLSKSASGIAILALRDPVPGEPEEVRRARAVGYSVTSGQLQRGAVGVAAGVPAPGVLGASVGVVAMDDLGDPVVTLVCEAASRLAVLSTA